MNLVRCLLTICKISLCPTFLCKRYFYMHQLSINVWNIQDLKTNQSKIYLYHEGVANKGPDEVCYFLLDYINTAISDTVKHLIFFIDVPSGQNKNHTVIRFLKNFCDNKRFSRITLNFPVCGHSFSACNQDFGTIKRLLRHLDRILLKSMQSLYWGLVSNNVLWFTKLKQKTSLVLRPGGQSPIWSSQTLMKHLGKECQKKCLRS